MRHGGWIRTSADDEFGSHRRGACPGAHPQRHPPGLGDPRSPRLSYTLRKVPPPAARCIAGGPSLRGSALGVGGQ